MGLTWLSSAGLLAPAQPRDTASDAAAPGLRTVAEKTDYHATAKHADVVALLDAIAKQYPDKTRRATMGQTEEGRDIPMLIVADPPVASAAEAGAAKAKDHRIVVLAIADIHAGEVCGKEALPMLARDMLAEPAKLGTPELLKNLIFVIVPIYNADGNERFSKDNRPGQVGPDEMGIRENSKGLDLNRDFIKVESKEAKALVGTFVEWDPEVFIDCHTTDGSYHRFLITYAGPKNPAGDAKLIDWTRDEFFPHVNKALKAKHGVDSFWYGSFEGGFADAPRGHTRWETFPAEGRYGTTYFGMRNRVSALSEAYAYAPFKDRVLGTYDFVLELLRESAADSKLIWTMCRQADVRAAASGMQGTDDLVIRSEAKPWPDDVTILGYTEPMVDGHVQRGEPTEYRVKLWDKFEPTLSVKRAFAYAMPPECEKIAAKLREHGIKVLRATSPVEAKTETYTIDKAQPASREYQGHVLVHVDATATPGTSTIEKGWYIVPMDQPLGSLAGYLLEPACEDGLATWNYFDAWLNVGGKFPVQRVMERREWAGEELP
ncbi:MAG: M14 family metallopeptidase [Phycisphaerales bacterium]